MQTAVESFTPYNPDFAAYRDGLAGQLTMLARNTQRPMSAAFASATLAEIDHPDEIGALQILYAANPERTPPEALRMLLASRTDVLMQRTDRPYHPEGYATVADWLAAAQFMREDETARAQYHYNLAHRNLGTSVSQRYFAIKFLSMVLEHRTGLFPTRVDVGCGDNTGNRRVVLSGAETRFRFDPVEVMVGRKLGSLVASAEKSALLEPFLGAHDVAQRTICLDLADPDDPAIQRWRRAGLTPEERASGKVVELGDALLAAPVDPDRLELYQADVTKPDDLERILQVEGPSDMVSAVALIHQGNSRDRRRKIEAMDRLRRPGRPMVVVDFLRRSGSNKALLDPIKEWLEMNVYVRMDDVRFEDTFVRVMAATSGRWQAVRFFKELADLADGGPYEDEVRLLVPS